jgi:serine/threonine protein phosphatase PrpC
MFSPRKRTRIQDVPTTLRVAARTDVGKVRERNEDGFVVADLDRNVTPAVPARLDAGHAGVLLAVADGMGGAEAGDVASAIALDDLRRIVASPPANVPRSTLLEQAFHHAHRAIRDASEGQPEKRRMGTTLTAVHVQGGEAYVAHVGDSRAYLVRAGRIAPITHDQTVVQQLVDAGLLAPEDIDASPFRSVILQAVGHQPDLDVAVSRVELRSRDCIVLCSDGLTNAVSDAELLGTVLTSMSLDVAAQRLVDLANQRGGKDNITVVLAGVGGELPPPEIAAEQSIEVVKAFVARLPSHH